MKYFKHPATIIASIALFVAFGGGAAAYASGLINGSQIKNHSISAKKLTKKAIKSLHGQRGAKGATGATGAAGAAGAPGATGPAGPGARWATVQPNSAIVRQSGGITITHPQTGAYILNFGSDVSKDLILASPTLINDGAFRGVVLAASCVDYSTFCLSESVPTATKQNFVAVFTTDTTNATQEDHSFYAAAIGPASTAASHASTKMGALGR